MNTKSLQTLASIRVAVSICNHPLLKNEVFCMKGSDFDLNKKPGESDRKSLWNALIDQKAIKVLKDLCLSKHLHQYVLNVINPIARRILGFVIHFEASFGLSKKYIADHLGLYSFNSNGVINYKSVAELIVNDSAVDISQRFKLACIYFLYDELRDAYTSKLLWEQLTEDQINEMYNFKLSQADYNIELIRLWCHHYKNPEQDLTNGVSFWKFGFEKGVESGNVIAVKRCWSKLDEENRNAILINSALKAVSYKCKHDEGLAVFLDKPFLYYVRKYIPSDNYVDILIFLHYEINENQWFKVLKKDIEVSGASRVLWSFLEWPYQDHFLETATRLWGVLPNDSYANLLIRITRKFDISYLHSYIFHLTDGEERCYDFHALLREFWCQSPSSYKRYVFKEQLGGLLCRTVANYGHEIIFRLFSIRSLTRDDQENIELILKSATTSEKESLMFSELGVSLFVMSLRCQRFQMFETFMTWINLPEIKFIQFKETVIASPHSLCFCKDMIMTDKKDAANKFIEWSFGSNEREIRSFKKRVAYESNLDHDLICKGMSKYVKQLVDWCFSTEEEIDEYKKSFFIDAKCAAICQGLICGGKWVHVDEFLYWLFGTEEAVLNFIRNDLFEKLGVDIHFELTRLQNWESAETFYTWIGLSGDEIITLKKNTLLCPRSLDSLYDNEPNVFSSASLSKKNAVEIYLRWLIKDEPTLFKFRDTIEKWSTGRNGRMWEATHQLIQSAVELRLCEILDENKGKRKSYNLPENAKMKTSKNVDKS